MDVTFVVDDTIPKWHQPNCYLDGKSGYKPPKIKARMKGYALNSSREMILFKLQKSHKEWVPLRWRVVKRYTELFRKWAEFSLEYLVANQIELNVEQYRGIIKNEGECSWVWGN